VNELRVPGGCSFFFLIFSTASVCSEMIYRYLSSTRVTLPIQYGLLVVIAAGQIMLLVCYRGKTMSTCSFPCGSINYEELNNEECVIRALVLVLCFIIKRTLRLLVGL